MPLTQAEEALFRAALKANHRDQQINMDDPLGPPRDITCGDPVGDLFRLLLTGQPITVESLKAAGVPLPEGYRDNSEGVPR
jgi:hypothetical protein